MQRLLVIGLDLIDSSIVVTEAELTSTNYGGATLTLIYDFEHLTDKINMQGSGATAGMLSIVDVGGHAEVRFSGADLIVVVNQGATLTAADFQF